MKIDTSKKWYVVNEETELTVIAFETEEEAKERAEWMTDYHKESYIVENMENEDWFN